MPSTLPLEQSVLDAAYESLREKLLALIVAEMKAQGISKLVLSERSGLSRSAMDHILGTKRGGPTGHIRLDSVARMLRALDLEPHITVTKVRRAKSKKRPEKSSGAKR